MKRTFIIFTIVSINLLIKLPILIIINIFFPILHKFIPKFKQYNIKNITTEQEQNMQKNINLLKNKYVIKDYEEYFHEAIESLSKKEIIYIQNIKTNELHYLKLHYVFKIIDNAKQALSYLENVTKNDKKVSYYESGKKASLDDLYREYTSQLNEQDYKRITLLIAEKEIKFKRLLVKMKKDRDLFFNFYLTLLSLNSLDNLKVKEDEKDTFNLFKNLFEFYRVGHATPNQIYKSVAIQIYNLYKNDFEDNELKKIIAKLLTSTFNLNEDYKNFNNIEEQKPYIKNLIYQFPLFECNTKQSNKQFKEINRFLLTSNTIIPKHIPKFFRKKIINLYLQNLLKYYQIIDSLNFFGFNLKIK